MNYYELNISAAAVQIDNICDSSGLGHQALLPILFGALLTPLTP